MVKFPAAIRSTSTRLLGAGMMSLLLVLGLLASRSAAAQSLPVTVNASGNTATVDITVAGQSLADITIRFDDASGLSPASLGVSAQLVSLADPALLSRLPDPQLTRLDSALPLLVTIEPPAAGGLSFQRTAKVEFHTHALVYSAGSSYRLLKAPLGGKFRDITEDVAPGSVRARGTTGGFSQFLIVADLRETGTVAAQKTTWLRNRIAMLPASEQGAFSAYLDAHESALGRGDFANAIGALDQIRARAAARAGTQLADQWRATRDADNHAGELIAGADTLKFSTAYLRDYGQ